MTGAPSWPSLAEGRETLATFPGKSYSKPLTRWTSSFSGENLMAVFSIHWHN